MLERELLDTRAFIGLGSLMGGLQPLILVISDLDLVSCVLVGPGPRLGLFSPHQAWHPQVGWPNSRPGDNSKQHLMNTNSKYPSFT